MAAATPAAEMTRSSFGSPCRLHQSSSPGSSRRSPARWLRTLVQRSAMEQWRLPGSSRSARPSYCFPFMPAPRCRPPRHGGSRRCPTKSVRIAWPQILTAPAAAGVHVNRRNLSRKPTVERVSEIPALELPINSNPTRHRHWFQALTQHFCGRCRVTSRKLLGKIIPCPTGSDLPKNSILIDGASSFAHQIRLRDKQTTHKNAYVAEICELVAAIHER